MSSMTVGTDALVFLDASGDAVLPSKTEELSSERDFLEAASQPNFSSHRYLVRGATLCQWAQEWCEGRSYPFSRPLSPRDAWKQLNLAWTDADICQLQQEGGSLFPAAGGFIDTLFLLFPDGPWNQAPCIGHAARWCLWLEKSALGPLHPALPLLSTKLADWCQQLEHVAGKNEEYHVAASAYALKTAPEADVFLRQWLIDGNPKVLFPEFVPDAWKIKVKQAWQFRPQDEGVHDFWQRVSAFPYSHELRTIAAEIVLVYLKNHPQQIAPLLTLLRPYLDGSVWQQLEKLCPPNLPTPFPSTASPVEALQWTRDQYLPYRQWQVLYGSDADRRYSTEQAAQFARWLYSFYPQAVAGGSGNSYLAISASAQMQSSLCSEANTVILWVIPDGLTLSDGEKLRELLSAENRLRLAEERLLFTTLPTITCFCKPALINGCPPDAVTLSETPTPSAPNAFLLYDKTMRNEAAAAKPGQILIWTCHSEPDKTYHKNQSRETTRHEVVGKLHTIVQQIRELVAAIPNDLALRVIVTTDHGRLLSDDSSRRHSLPYGAKSEGRAAWGTFDAKLTDDLVALPYDAFRLRPEQTVWVATDENAFVQNDGKGGHVAFAHGGLWPEEVTVPWYTFVRDAHAPTLRITVKGTGRSGGAGTFIATFDNAEEILVTLNSLHLQAEKSEWRWNLPASEATTTIGTKTVTMEHAVERWPSQEECARIRGAAIVSLPNGLRFEIALDVSLTADTMSRQNLSASDLLDL